MVSTRTVRYFLARLDGKNKAEAKRESGFPQGTSVYWIEKNKTYKFLNKSQITPFK
jgi:hypothetical protein